MFVDNISEFSDHEKKRHTTGACANHVLSSLIYIHRIPTQFYNIDVMAICETWLKSKRDTNVIKDMLPNGYSIEHTPRPSGKGGGVAIIYRSSCMYVCMYVCIYSSDMDIQKFYSDNENNYIFC